LQRYVTILPFLPATSGKNFLSFRNYPLFWLYTQGTIFAFPFLLKGALMLNPLLFYTLCFSYSSPSFPDLYFTTPRTLFIHRENFFTLEMIKETPDIISIKGLGL